MKQSCNNSKLTANQENVNCFMIPKLRSEYRTEVAKYEMLHICFYDDVNDP